MAAFTFGLDANNRNYRKQVSEMQRSIARMEIDRKEKSLLQRAFNEVMRVTPGGRTAVMFDPTALPKLPHDYQYEDASPLQEIQPVAMFGAPVKIEDPGLRVRRFAEWLTSPENPRFTKVIANRLWKKVMGRGLIEPVDELTDATVASIPELMTELEKILIDNGHDLKAFLRILYHSRAYQREVVTREIEPDAPFHFEGPVLRRMTAEQIWDSIVTLVNPVPEEGDWKKQQTLELQLAHGRAMSDAIGGYRPEQLIEFAKQIVAYRGTLAEEKADLTRELAVARKEKNRESTARLGSKMKEIQALERQRIHQLVYQPSLGATVKGQVALSCPDGAVEKHGLSELINTSGQVNTSPLRKIQNRMEKEMVDRAMEKAGITDSVEKRRYLTFRKSATRMKRAAFISSPAPPGHFLRQFGQSDRETIENASAESSVPQALQLMNGSTFATISRGSSVLARDLAKRETHREKIDLIYLALLSRMPTEEERGMAPGRRKNSKPGNLRRFDFRTAQFSGISIRPVNKIKIGRGMWAKESSVQLRNSSAIIPLTETALHELRATKREDIRAGEINNPNFLDFLLVSFVGIRFI